MSQLVMAEVNHRTLLTGGFFTVNLSLLKIVIDVVAFAKLNEAQPIMIGFIDRAVCSPAIVFDAEDGNDRAGAI